MGRHGQNPVTGWTDEYVKRLDAAPGRGRVLAERGRSRSSAIRVSLATGWRHFARGSSSRAGSPSCRSGGRDCSRALRPARPTASSVSGTRSCRCARRRPSHGSRSWHTLSATGRCDGSASRSLHRAGPDVRPRSSPRARRRRPEWRHQAAPGPARVDRGLSRHRRVARAARGRASAISKCSSTPSCAATRAGRTATRRCSSTRRPRRTRCSGRCPACRSSCGSRPTPRRGRLAPRWSPRTVRHRSRS